MRLLKKWLFGDVSYTKKPFGYIYLTWWRKIPVHDFIPYKGNIVAVNITKDGRTIVAPVCIPPLFVSDYVKKYKSSEYYYGVLQQHISLLEPYKSWGMYIPLKFNGQDRPSCDLNEIRWKKTPTFNLREPK